jgi:ferredoxin
MIVAEQKPIKDVLSMCDDYNRVLIAGCRACVAVCSSGGAKEVAMLASALRLGSKKEDKPLEVEEITLERQCEPEMVDLATDSVKNCDAVISLACGAGAQLMAERFPEKVVLPGCNTTFLGVAQGLGEWSERCAGCGNCVLDKTGGLCPIARCSKQILNGPCGGSEEGKCEVSKDIDCVWQLIVDRLTRLNRLEMLEDIFPVKDWTPSGYSAPRKMVREDLKS